MKAVVVNNTDRVIHLYAHDDSIAVPPTRGGQSVRVPIKFVQWQKPHPDHIHILHYLDKNNNRIDEPHNPTTVAGRKALAREKEQAEQARQAKPTEKSAETAAS